MRELAIDYAAEFDCRQGVSAWQKKQGKYPREFWYLPSADDWKTLCWCEGEEQSFGLFELLFTGWLHRAFIPIATTVDRQHTPQMNILSVLRVEGSTWYSNYLSFDCKHILRYTYQKGASRVYQYSTTTKTPAVTNKDNYLRPRHSATTAILFPAGHAEPPAYMTSSQL